MMKETLTLSAQATSTGSPERVGRACRDALCGARAGSGLWNRCVPSLNAVLLLIGTALLVGTVLTVGAVWASDGTPLAPSGSGAGGDSVGSLPLRAGPPRPGAQSTSAGGAHPGLLMPSGPSRPILTLVGTQSELDALVFDAYGVGSINSIDLGNGLVRMEFHGHITVELRRAELLTSLVSAQIVIGSSFHGGKAKVKVNDVVKSKQILTEGARDMRLRQLVQAGIVDQGLNWHAVSLQGVHAVLDVSDQGNLIRIQQRD